MTIDDTPTRPKTDEQTGVDLDGDGGRAEYYTRFTGIYMCLFRQNRT